MKYLIILALVLGGASLAQAQRIILDLPTKAGELTLFPEVGKPNNYYYVADKARLAVDAAGTPQFSFLRYVTNERALAGEAERLQGEGGGILHAVVSLAVTEEQLTAARQELRRTNAEGQIIGPVVYKSGTFGLVTSFNDDNGELTKELVGLGQAPILDGQQAAISMHLTKLGATLLWKSFQTAAPDISFSFMMTMGGYRLPKEATIEADWEDVYESMEIGLKAGYGGKTTVQAGAGAGANGGTASQGGAAGNRTANAARNSGNGEDAAPAPRDSPADNDETPPADTDGGDNNDTSPTAVDTTGQGSGGETPAMAAAPALTSGGTSGGAGGGVSATSEMPYYFGADLKFQFEKLRKDGAIRITQMGSDAKMDELINLAYGKLADMMFERVESGSSGQGDPAAALRALRGNNESASTPVSGITFSFRLKEKRRTGTFRMDLNKWTTDELVMRFDENIGNLTRYIDDPDHFVQVNTDDDLYRQRNIYPILDGYNAQDFGEYINFVNVRLKKDHGNGVTTDRDVRIDRNNFNQSGNNFALVYGWNGEKSRANWMNYEYEVLWSFFGDVEVREPVQTTSFSAINLAAPYRKKEIEFQADPDLLAEQEVRMVSVEVFYDVGGKEFTKQVILNPSRDQLSEKTEYLTGAADGGYEYQITWRLRGNRVVRSERMAATDGLLFVDELPN